MLSKAWNAIVNNRIVWAICAVIAAFLIWNYIVNEQNPTRTATIPFTIEYSGEEQILERYKLKLESGYPQQVRMRVTGTYSDVAKIQSDPVILVDLLGVQTAGVHQVAFSIEYPTGMSSNNFTVSPATGETNIDTDYITLSFVEIKSKTLEVYYDEAITFDVGENYIYNSSEMSLSPNSVTIEGPAEIIDQIDHARVSPVELKEKLTKTTSIERPIELVLKSATSDSQETEMILTEPLIKEIKMSTETVLVTLPIQSKKTVDLTVDIMYGGGGTQNNTTYDIEPKYVEIVGDADALKDIESLSVGNIDLSKFESNDFQQEMAISYPEGVEENTVKTAILTVSISGVTSRELTVTNFSTANLPEGYSSKIETQGLEIIVRGPVELVEALDPSRLRAIVDLKDLTTAGTVLRPVTISIDGEENAAIGVIDRDSNRVTVVLTKN